MRKSLFSIAFVATVASCGANPEVALNATCNAVMADPDVQRNILAASLSAEDYCACASKQMLALPDEERDLAITTLQTMETLMAEHDGSAEAAFEALIDAGRAENATPEAVTAYENMDALGEQLEDFLDEMQAAGGVCPI